MPQDLTDDKSTLVQVMAWYREATSHYLSQCWSRSMSPNGVTRLQWVKVRESYLNLGALHVHLVNRNIVILYLIFRWIYSTGLPGDDYTKLLPSYRSLHNASVVISHRYWQLNYHLVGKHRSQNKNNATTYYFGFILHITDMLYNL